MVVVGSVENVDANAVSGVKMLVVDIGSVLVISEVVLKPTDSVVVVYLLEVEKEDTKDVKYDEENGVGHLKVDAI